MHTNYKAARDAFRSYLDAISRPVVMVIEDDIAHECYIITKHGAFFEVFSIGGDDISIDNFHSVAQAVGFATKQAVHTYVAVFDDRPNQSCVEVEVSREVGHYMST